MQFSMILVVVLVPSLVATEKHGEERHSDCKIHYIQYYWCVSFQIVAAVVLQK